MQGCFQLALCQCAGMRGGVLLCVRASSMNTNLSVFLLLRLICFPPPPPTAEEDSAPSAYKQEEQEARAFPRSHVIFPTLSHHSL